MAKDIELKRIKVGLNGVIPSLSDTTAVKRHVDIVRQYLAASSSKQTNPSNCCGTTL